MTYRKLIDAIRISDVGSQRFQTAARELRKRHFKLHDNDSLNFHTLHQWGIGMASLEDAANDDTTPMG